MTVTLSHTESAKEETGAVIVVVAETSTTEGSDVSVQASPSHISPSSVTQSQSLSLQSHSSVAGVHATAVHDPSTEFHATHVVVIVPAAKHAPTHALQSCITVKTSSIVSSQSLSTQSQISTPPFVGTQAGSLSTVKFHVTVLLRFPTASFAFVFI